MGIWTKTAIRCAPLIVACCLPAGAWSLPDVLSGQSETGREAPAKIELSCKIQPAPDDRGYRFWRVDLRRAGGELVRRVLKGSGDTVRFKGLEPGIYLACIVGERGRQTCKSFDLTPPAGRDSFRFSARIEAPRAVTNAQEEHRVSVKRLSVPKEARDELSRAEAAQQRGEKPEMQRHLERALVLHPDYPEALNNLGVYFHRERDFERSAKYLRRATRVDPDFYPAWVNLGGTLLSSGQFREALEANKHAYDLRSDEALTNTQLALSYYYLKQYEEAKKYFKRVQDIDPLSAASPELYLAHIALAQKDDGEAQSLIRKFLELHPNSPRAADLKETLHAIAGKTGVPALAEDIVAGP